MAATSSSTWTSWREALKVVSQPSHPKKTAALAFVIGTIFFAINQLGLVLSGHADGVVWPRP
jgi:hypothetical protein